MHIGPDLLKLITDKFGSRAQARAAEHIGISGAYLSDMCNGRRGISADVAIKVSRVFGDGTGERLYMRQSELALIAARKDFKQHLAEQAMRASAATQRKGKQP